MKLIKRKTNYLIYHLNKVFQKLPEFIKTIVDHLFNYSGLDLKHFKEQYDPEVIRKREKSFKGFNLFNKKEIEKVTKHINDEMDEYTEEFYNDKEFLTLRDYELAENNWRDIIKNYPTEILMPLKSIEVYEVLQQDSDWVQIYEGNVCGIFVKKGCEKSSYIEPNHDIDYYKRTMFDSVTFGKKLKFMVKNND